MANEYQYRHSASGATLYAVLLNSTGGVWNGSSFEAMTVANWGTYAIAMTEQDSTSQYYYADRPAGVSVSHNVSVFRQAGGAPAVSDSLLGQFHTADVGSWAGVDVTSSYDGEPLVTAGNIISAGSGSVGARTTSSTVDLSGAAPTVGYYDGAMVYIWSGTGNGQARYIRQYDAGINRTAQIVPDWTTTPDATSKYVVAWPIAPTESILSDGVRYDGANVDSAISSRLAAADITLSSGKVTPVDADGLTFVSIMEALMAVLSGVATVSGNSVSFKKRDGTTSKMTITYGTADGERTVSVVDS